MQDLLRASGLNLGVDALVGNVDRSPRNPYLSPSLGNGADFDARPYDWADHVLIGSRADISGADTELAQAPPTPGRKPSGCSASSSCPWARS